jgi:hypothetical protein
MHTFNYLKTAPFISTYNIYVSLGLHKVSAAFNDKEANMFLRFFMIDVCSAN